MERSHPGRRAYDSLPSVGVLEAVRSAETGKRPSGWLEKWQFVNARFRSHLQAASMDDLSFEGNVYRQLQHLVPEGSSILSATACRSATWILSLKNKIVPSVSMPTAVLTALTELSPRLWGCVKVQKLLSRLSLEIYRFTMI